MSQSGSDEVLALGRQMALGLTTLARSVRIYSTDNAIFLEPLRALLDQVNRTVALDGKLDLKVLGTSLYVNNRLVETPSPQGHEELAQLFQAHGVGGFVVPDPTSLGELARLFRVFAADRRGEPVPSDGLAGFKLDAVRLRPWNRVQEEGLAAARAGPAAAAGTREGGRTREAVAAYARTILWVDHQLKRLREGAPDESFATATRVAQDLVEVSARPGGELLPLLVNGEDDRALAHHLVNTAVIAVGFGAELGLSRAQLRELAAAALFGEMQLARLPPVVWLPADPDKLPSVDQNQRSAAWQGAARQALAKGGGARLNQIRALSAIEMHEPYAAEAQGAARQAGSRRQATELLFASRLLSIAAQFDALTSPQGDRAASSPDHALGAMWGPLRHRFDPELLWAFLRTMARRPVKVLPRSEGGVVDAPG